ncbi:MAG: type IX secretion system membrane protein PorP/SprF, partial [Ekhidna sp.]
MKYTATLLLFLSFFGSIQAQTNPIFNQKMTDYFTYDPSRTGFSGGSLVFTHQQLSSGLESAPSTQFLGGHTRFFYDRVGVGGSIYYQQAGITKTYRITLNGAYHLQLNDQYKLSFGLAPEFSRGELNFENIFVIDSDDQVINNYGNQSDFDISSGISLHHALFDVG